MSFEVEGKLHKKLVSEKHNVLKGYGSFSTIDAPEPPDWSDFENEIARYESSSEIDRLYDSAERIEKNGVENNLILERLKNKDKNISYLRQKTNVEKLNIITNNCNQAITLLNDFINYRNKRFSPILPDNEIKNMVTTPKQKLIECKNFYFFCW